jgi:hypothetical protein
MVLTNDIPSIFKVVLGDDGIESHYEVEEELYPKSLCIWLSNMSLAE